MKMDLLSVMRAGFRDELEKIAGFTRIGRRPMSASTLLKKKNAEIMKLSNAAATAAKSKGLLKGKGKYVAVAGLGALGYDQAQKAKNDWQMGRQMRKQQGF